MALTGGQNLPVHLRFRIDVTFHRFCFRKIGASLKFPVVIFGEGSHFLAKFLGRELRFLSCVAYAVSLDDGDEGDIRAVRADFSLGLRHGSSPPKHNATDIAAFRPIWRSSLGECLLCSRDICQLNLGLR